MDKLVAAIDERVSKNAMAKYERGAMMPNSTVHWYLHETYWVPPLTFMR